MKKIVVAILLLNILFYNSAFCYSLKTKEYGFYFETMLVAKLTLNIIKTSFNNFDYSQKVVCYLLKKEKEAIKYETKKLTTDATICTLDLFNTFDKITLLKLTNISRNR